MKKIDIELIKRKKGLHLLLLISFLGVFVVPVLFFLSHINENTAVLLFVLFFLGMFVCVHFIHNKSFGTYLVELKKIFMNLINKFKK